MTEEHGIIQGRNTEKKEYKEIKRIWKIYTLKKTKAHKKAQDTQ